jgi:hypothetical protein
VKGQVDFFLDALVDAPIKEDRALLEFPFFSLAKRPRMEPIVYSDSRVLPPFGTEMSLFISPL